MTYAHDALIFNLIDVALILALLLLTLKAMSSNVIDELFSTTTIVGSIFAASCFHVAFAKFVYVHITKNVSISFLNSMGIILIFVFFFFLGRFISKYLKGLIGDKKPTGKYETAASLFLSFLRYFIIFSVVIYIFHTKTKLFHETKYKYGNGIVYRFLKDTGRDILNITAPSKKYLYYY